MTGTTTLAALSEKFEQRENEAAATQVSPPPTTEPSPSTINSNGELKPSENGTTDTTAIQPAEVAAPAEQEINSSSFSFDETIAPPPSENGKDVPSANQQVFDWKKEIKSIDPNELLKEAGISDFAIELDKHIKGGGQPLDYLQARAIDYNKVTDQSLLKEDLRVQYPTLTPSQIELMFNRKYVLSEDALDEDREFVQIQMQADAYRVRQQKIVEQQKFKIAENPLAQKDEGYEQWKANTQSQSQLAEKTKEYFSNHAATKLLNESKRVTVNLGDEVAPYNFNVSQPELITRNLTDDGTTWHKLTSTATGEPDVQKQQLITLFAADPQKYSRDIFNYGKAIGKQSLVAEGQNARKPQSNVSDNTFNVTPTYRVGKFTDRTRD